MISYQTRLLRDLRDNAEMVQRLLNRDDAEIDIHVLHSVVSQLTQATHNANRLIGSKEFEFYKERT